MILDVQGIQNILPHRYPFLMVDAILEMERFKRIDANTILYRATIDDPATFSKPWTLEYPFVATSGPVYEYACHEGNYAMQDILCGARKIEAEGSPK